MIRRKLAVLASLAVAVTILSAGPAHAGSGTVLVANLTGAAEVPGPGEADGSGKAYVTVDTGEDLVCVILRVRRVATPTAAHIHVGTPAEAGPVVVPLVAPSHGYSFGCATVTGSLARALANSPEAYYVNVHNAEFPAGAVRGQLAEV